MKGVTILGIINKNREVEKKMKLENLKEKAKKLKVKNYEKMAKKQDIIWSIQKTEGHNDCFKKIPDCCQMDCCFREDCL